MGREFLTWVNIVAVEGGEEWTVWSGMVAASKVLIEVAPGEVTEREP